MLKRPEIIKITLLLMTIFGLTTQTFAQGFSRSKGLGFRFGLWKTARSSSLISFSGNRVEVSGAGSWMYFFSRFNNEWFYEFHLGVFASVIQEEIFDETGLFIRDKEDITVIIPFLLGMRYDIFASRSHGGLQPYLSFGAGPYWITNVDAPLNNSQVEKVESGLKPGAYAGGGLNIGLLSWFALNFDLKYHFVDLKFDKNFSGLDFGLGFIFMWGQKREIVRVLGVRPIVNDIYPAYYQFYNLYPLAMVTVKNMTKSPIEVNVRSNVRYYSERSNDTGFITIAGKETKDIPITAIFGKRIRTVKDREVAVIDIEVEARAGSKITKKLSSSIMIHNRNAWNGEMDKLIFFVTPDRDRILELSRSWAGELEFSNSNLRNFQIAKHFFEELGKLGLRYHSDPNIPFYKDDRVQFASETLTLKSGDCDDLVVLYASLLESVGINTAFVEVQDPEKELAHLYLMFNSGVPVEQRHLISSNEKRYLIRENSIGQKKVWIPVETTVIENGFEEAWKAGALEYLQAGDLRGGLGQGWMKVIDVE